MKAEAKTVLETSWGILDEIVAKKTLSGLVFLMLFFIIQVALLHEREVTMQIGIAKSVPDLREQLEIGPGVVLFAHSSCRENQWRGFPGLRCRKAGQGSFEKLHLV